MVYTESGWWPATRQSAYLKMFTMLAIVAVIRLITVNHHSIVFFRRFFLLFFFAICLPPSDIIITYDVPYVNTFIRTFRFFDKMQLGRREASESLKGGIYMSDTGVTFYEYTISHLFVVFLAKLFFWQAVEEAYVLFSSDTRIIAHFFAYFSPGKILDTPVLYYHAQ